MLLWTTAQPGAARVVRMTIPKVSLPPRSPDTKVRIRDLGEEGIRGERPLWGHVVSKPVSHPRGAPPLSMSPSSTSCPVLGLADSRQVCRCLWKAPGHGGQGPHGQAIVSVGTKLQNKEHVAEVLRRAKFKFPGHHNIQGVGLYCLMRMSLKTRWLKSGSSQVAAGSSTSLIMVPWTNGGPCPQENLGAAPSLHPPVNPTFHQKHKTYHFNHL